MTYQVGTRMMSPTRTKCWMLALLLLWVVSKAESEVIQEFEISEGVSVGTSIGFIGKSITGLSHPPPPPPYLIVPSPGSPVDSDLTIDQSNGEILTRVQLDREVRDSYSLVAIPMSGENIRVIIRVRDENDHAPEFPSPFMHVEFPENTPRDVKRTLQPARDKDLGIFNTQRYTISAGNVNNAFRLSSHRERDGVLYLDLQVNGFLDRETIPSYSLLIEAFDGGVPPLKGSMTINITITDQNDNAPIWQFPRASNPDAMADGDDISLNQSRYFATVPENASIGTSVLQVFATDIDEGPNGQVTYSINRRQSDKDSVFRIDRNTGIIYVNGPLDFETKEVYELVVVARDSGIQALETTVFVTIRVLDLNDNQMEINISFFSGELDEPFPKISEKAMPGEFVARISIIDPVTKQEYTNASISLDNGDGSFGLETVNSAVYLVVGAKRLDREKRPSYTLTVVAKDKGNPSLNASSKFTILVEDDNDSPPSFELEEYHASVPELAEPGSVVIQVKAEDEDSGENSRILYELLSTPETHSDWFEINEETGVISTRAHIDCEIDPTPVLTVLAKDHGLPPLTGSATVVVHLIDTNDTPIFNQGFYNTSVAETAPYGTCLLRVSASDPDCGINAELSYNLMHSERTDLPFSINLKSGEICVSGPLDYEKKEAYQILVSASDAGGLSSTAVVNIQVIDENDNVPTFYPRTFSVSVREGSVSSGSIVVVAATDKDSNHFGQITYSFVEGNEEGIFSIKKNTGEISMIRAPVKGRTQYRLKVTARDGDDQISSQNAEVTVYVVGNSVNAPVFTKPRYLFTISEDINVQSLVGTVTASASSGRIRYALTDGDPDSYFTVDQLTGNIKVATKLDHESHPAYFLNIQARADQHEVASYCQVEIRVMDVNDHAPTFGSKDVKVWIPETAEVGSVVYVSQAEDQDSGKNGEVSYSLVQNPFNMFKIDKFKGEISLQKSLDYETMKEFALVVKARDNGSPAKTSESLTIHVEVQDSNDNAPVWFKKRHEFWVREKSPAGTFIGRLTKQDKIQNGAVKFQLQPPVDGFQVDIDSGIISTTSQLYRNVSSQQLKVVAYNQGQSAFKVEFSVKVHIVDGNSRFQIPMAEDNNGIMQYHVKVSESLAAESEIAQVIALDEDYGNNGRISYRIQDSPLQNIIGIVPATGVVYLKQKIDRESQDEYIVKVTATDHGIPPLSSTATIHVHVVDENDNSPQFIREDFKFTLRENNEPGVVIGHVTAHDRDAGGNSAIKYFIQPQHPDFTIDENKGTITAMSTLDREKQVMYELQVVAIDQGSPPLQTEALVQVTLTDDNDNDPQISDPDQDSIMIREKLPVGTEIARILAFDADEGRNAKISYFLNHDDFAVNRETGSLTTKRVLTRDSKAFHNLQLRARDNGSPARESFREYRIEVVSIHDGRADSLFLPSKLHFKVRENATIGHTVGKILATVDNTFGKPQIFYRITGDLDAFEVHPNTGVIVVANKLNYEDTPSYTLKVKATLQTPHSYSESVVSVMIDVVDVNDERPKFPADPINIVIPEGSPVGSSVWNFSAVDRDAGLNGVVHYKISHQKPSGKFRINMLTGTLYLQSPLDYEQSRFYVLVVTATDQAEPVESRLNSSVTVNVVIKDENDNAPTFTSPSQVDIYELEPLKAEFHTVIATDPDSSTFGQVSYKIVSGNDEGIFSLHQENGRLTLAKPLKVDVKRYSLNITAFDHGPNPNFVYQLLSINVKADKHHSPRFNSAKYEAKVVENAGVGTFLVRVAASSPEVDRNNTIFTIPEGLAEGKFAVNPSSGTITLIGPIDRETRSEYSLVVYLQDKKQLYVYDSTTVHVQVLDDNDNAPLFHDSCADLTVPENNELGVIHVFTAEDLDIGKNGEVTFVIASGNSDNMFNVDLHTGRLTGRPLDREKRSQYNIIVVAQDQGSPSKKTSCNMTIFVDDENDSPITFVPPTKPEGFRNSRGSSPSFSQSPSGKALYSASIPENVPIGTTILKVQANDADVGVNALIKYSLNNESHWHFVIDNTTGELKNAGFLDREKISSYIFEVAATDGGLYDSRSSTAAIHLTITDVNDNRPQFKENPILARISPVGVQNVVQVMATDADEGTNAAVTYSLESPSPEFTINSENGQISTTKNLASEQGKIFHLRVIAKDQGTPALTSTALVVVQVGDKENSNNQLRFHQSSYSASIPENSFAGSEVLKVSAIRRDGRRSSEITYSIVGGNEDGAFEIGRSSGVVSVKNSSLLDRESTPAFKLVITASTEGKQPLVAHTVAVIGLQDVNDNFPHFTQSSYIASVWEGNTKGTFVTQVTATDSDVGPNANVVYHIIEGNQDNAFVIEPPFSGIVKTNIVLDREILDEYKLTIIATDEGSPQMTGTCVLHVNVIDIQDQSPIFPPHSVIDVKEDVPVGSLITTMVANDVDTNPTLVYSFTDQGNPEGMFTIGKYTGRVALIKPLDYETIKVHTARIQVSDSVHTAQTTLTVNVLDENDHRPVFSKDVYRVLVSEGAKVGARVGQVNATDKDTNENGRIRYSLQAPEGSHSQPRFLRIDETSGILYTNATVNFNRNKPFVQMIVVAKDNGKPSLSSKTSLWVEVRPSHSHILKFSQSRYRASLSQNAKPGSVVTQLSVETTGHLGKGLHYHYSIVSGNDMEHFSISSHSGQVILAKEFDPSGPSTFNLMISADCINVEQCSSFTELSIEVLSESATGPRFDKPVYKVTVSENKPAGATLLKVHASESRTNGSVEYEITSGNDDNIVELNRKSGALVLKRSLDYDQIKNNYRIVIGVVEDELTTTAWNFTTVDITVDDENDNEPKFLFASYVGTVGENEPIGTTVTTIKATDLDKGIYGKLQYSILDGDGKDKFSIASSTGVVTTNAVFDYESKSRYYLTVRANDIGGKSSTTKLQIEIESKDEFSPQFVQRSYRFEVPLNAEPGHVIGRIEAVDQDRGPDGFVAYHLANPNLNFAINASNGYVVLKGTPNPNINSSFIVTASSGRAGSKTSQSTVEAVLGPPLKELEMAASSTTDWVLGILVAILLLLFITCGAFLLIHVRNKRQSSKGKSEGFNTPNIGTLDYATSATMRIGTGKQDSLYGSHYGNIMDLRGNERRRMNNAISELSDQSNSASSGRGSAEDGEEDEEICMINEGNLATHDDGDEDDNVSQSSVKNTQEYLARLGIRPNLTDDSTDNLYEGKGRGVDISTLIYSQISEDLNQCVLENKSSVTYKNVPQPSASGSLSSIVHNEEELAGNYNWDYLLDWGPQYQPLAHVFSEIAHLKDSSNRSEPTYCGILSNKISSSSSDKGSSSHQNFGASSVSSRRMGNVPRTGPLPPVPILPRSPIPNDMSFASGPISPSFAPAFSPLANRSPSISPLGSVSTSNIRTSQIHEDYGSEDLRM